MYDPTAICDVRIGKLFIVLYRAILEAENKVHIIIQNLVFARRGGTHL